MLLGQLQAETVSLVLGGGRGTRLFPLTAERSKPAVPLGGKFRLIDIALSNSIHSGLRQVFVLTQYNSASLNNHVARTYKFDAFSQGFVAILAAEQGLENDRGWFQGTADAVRHAARYLRDPTFRHVVIMPGDHLCRIDLRPVLELHEQSGADVTLVSTTVPRAEVQQYRILKLAEDGRVVRLERRPSSHEQLDALAMGPEERTRHRLAPLPEGEDAQYLAFMGIYLIRKDVLLEALGHASDQDLASDTLHRLFREGRRCQGYVFNGYWRDIGTIRSFYEASIELTADDPPFRFQDPEAPIYTRPRFLPSARIYRSTLDGALVADGCVIEGAHIERSVIGVRARVCEGARISRSVLFGADTFEGDNRRAAAVRGDDIPPLGIGPRSIIRNAIIDKNARIGEGCRLENVAGVLHREAEDYSIREGVIIVRKGAIIPPGTVI